MELLNDFWNNLREDTKDYGDFHRTSLFHRLRGYNEKEEDKILDFLQYLQNHDIIKAGLNFENNDIPFMTFTKYGKTLFENDVRRNVIFKAFLELYNSE